MASSRTAPSVVSVSTIVSSVLTVQVPTVIVVTRDRGLGPVISLVNLQEAVVTRRDHVGFYLRRRSRDDVLSAFFEKGVAA